MTNTTPLTTTDRARKYILGIPGAVSGQGGHGQTFAAACALVHGFALSEHDAFALLCEYNQRCSPPWSERELWHKVKSAATAPHDKARGHLLGDGVRALPVGYKAAPVSVKTSRPKLDPATSVEIFLKGFHCSEFDVWCASPAKAPSDWRLGGAWIMPYLYREDELVNVVSEFTTVEKDGSIKANPAGTGLTLPRNDWTERLSKQQPDTEAGAWIRMNPLDGKGVGDANVCAFRFALIECDGVPLDLQLPLLARLRLPIAAILTSGGRSYHAWVRADADDLNDYRTSVAKLLQLLARFGVDGANKNPSRLSRLPGVQRTIGATGNGQQRLLYLNPNPEPKSIL